MYNIALQSFIISQVIGLYMVIMAIIMASRPKFYKRLIANLELQNGVIFISASFTLLVGLMLLDIYNVWRWSFESMVTVICWAIVIKAVLWLAFPEKMLGFTKCMLKGNTYYLVLLIVAIIGVMLLSHGFYLFLHRGMFF